mmetsp:Transcript_23226/g.72583  ORF Transcript_23226/g.72583 Transcript_23226/m.72583 type:complete len:508 (+) Transcript_23226:308-1831(+)
MHAAWDMPLATLLVQGTMPEVFKAPQRPREGALEKLSSTGFPRSILLVFFTASFFSYGFWRLRCSGAATWLSGDDVKSLVDVPQCDAGSYACVLWPGLKEAMRAHRTLRMAYATALAGLSMAAPLAMVSAAFSNGAMLAAVVFLLWESLMFRVSWTPSCACILMAVDWTILRGGLRANPGVSLPNSSPGLGFGRGNDRGNKPSARAAAVAAGVGWLLITSQAVVMVVGWRMWPFLDGRLANKAGHANATHVGVIPRADFNTRAGLVRAARAMYGSSANEQGDLLAVRDNRLDYMVHTLMADRVRLCVASADWVAGGAGPGPGKEAKHEHPTEPVPGGGGGKILCKIHHEIGGSVYLFKKRLVLYLAAGWMRDGADEDGRARRFVEGIAPYAAARLPAGLQPGSSRVALLYQFPSGWQVIAEAPVPSLGPGEARAYAMPPRSLFGRLSLWVRGLSSAGGATTGVTHEGELLWMRGLQWVGVAALGAWLAHLPTRSRGEAPMGKSKTSL